MYIALAVPVVVVTEALSKEAVRFPVHVEEKLTAVDVVTRLPLVSTRLTDTKVEPPEDKELVDMFAAPSVKPVPVPVPILTVVEPVLVLEIVIPASAVTAVPSRVAETIILSVPWQAISVYVADAIPVVVVTEVLLKLAKEEFAHVDVKVTVFDAVTRLPLLSTKYALIRVLPPVEIVELTISSAPS
ncbi:MAG: hypothetical protein OEZ38_05900 [Gammaproteobacteria bacterium]|nr:hypothetical protein [Gammaproteobacteria bacterium]